jgi:signal peptidase I
MVEDKPPARYVPGRPSVVCPHCRTPQPMDQSFCGNCGWNIANNRPPISEEPMALPPKKKRGLLPFALVTFVVMFGAYVGSLQAGFAFATSTGTSMEPLLHAGDAVVIRKVAVEDLQQGDVVAVQYRSVYLLHRIVELYDIPPGIRMAVTKGDNLPDPEPAVPASRIRGRLIFEVPLLGAGARFTGAGNGYLFALYALTAAVLSGLIFRLARRHGL